MLSREIRAYKQANPKAKAQEIADALNAHKNYVYQVLNKKLKKVKQPTTPSEGQQILRDEITRLNDEITKYKNLTKFQEDRISFLADKVRELRLHHSGLEYVVSYLESRLGIEKKDDGSTV